MMNEGVKLSAIKFVQRVILVQTRGVQDPRVVIYKSSLALETCIPEMFYEIYSFKNRTTRTFPPAPLTTRSYQLRNSKLKGRSC
jgi:hypothetical protein